jgi:hypothetical protein
MDSNKTKDAFMYVTGKEMSLYFNNIDLDNFKMFKFILDKVSKESWFTTKITEYIFICCVSRGKYEYTDEIVKDCNIILKSIHSPDNDHKNIYEPVFYSCGRGTGKQNLIHYDYLLNLHVKSKITIEKTVAEKMKQFAKANDRNDIVEKIDNLFITWGRK